MMQGSDLGTVSMPGLGVHDMVFSNGQGCCMGRPFAPSLSLAGFL